MWVATTTEKVSQCSLCPLETENKSQGMAGNILSMCVLSLSDEFCRGPAKGYTEALEARLFETEEVLRRVLPCVATEDLSRVLMENPLDVGSSSRAVALDRKQAVEVWSRSPMKSLVDIQNWCNEHSRTAESASESANSTSLLQAPANHTGFQRATTPEEHHILPALEQHASTMGTLPAGQGRFGIEMTSIDMGVVTGPMPYEIEIYTQPMQQSQSQQTLQSQPQHHEQPSSQSQSQYARGSPMPSDQISSDMATENFSEQHNSAEMNRFPMGITRKFQNELFW